MWGGHAWQVRRARAYNGPNGFWGPSPQWGPGAARAPGQGISGAKPPKAGNLLAFGAQPKQQI